MIAVGRCKAAKCSGWRKGKQVHVYKDGFMEGLWFEVGSCDGEEDKDRGLGL